jgi:ribosomal protein L30E
MSVTERIQEAAEQDALIIGTEKSLKHMENIDVLAIASNAPAALQERVTAAATDDVDVQRLDVDNKELGSLCMKPFAASIVGITR